MYLVNVNKAAENTNTETRIMPTSTANARVGLQITDKTVMAKRKRIADSKLLEPEIYRPTFPPKELT